jgi:hypothetical protein
MGLARFFHDEEDLLTKKYDENVLGTADYLAPEQALDSHAVDIRADIYSLGATFYFCLTGRTPFAEGTVAQKLIWHQTRAPKPIRSFRPEVPEGIVGVIDKMMAKDVAQRYQTPQEVADALAPWTQAPIPPPPDNEMPQFSLAATRGPDTGAPLLTSRPPSDASPGPRKVWQVSGSGTQSAVASPPPAATNRQASQETPRDVRPSPTPSPAPPVALAPAPAPVPRAPAPAPAPVSPPEPPAPRRVPGTLSATVPVVTASPSDSNPSGNGSARQRKQGGAQQATLPRPDETFREAPEREAEDDSFPAVSTRGLRSRIIRRNEIDPALKRMLWIGLALSAALGIPGLLLLLFLLFRSSDGTKTKQPPREPVRVGPNTPGGLAVALKHARAGDRILLGVDINEANLSVTVPNVTIEPELGTNVVWRCPPLPPGRASEKPKLLIVEAVAGVTIKNLTLDGDQRTEALILVWGKCPGVRLESLRLQRSKAFGLQFVNCEGDRDNPIQVMDVDFLIPPGTSGVRFDILPGHKTIRQNRFITFSNCNFAGLGQKLTTPEPNFVDLATLKLPAGGSLEVRP